MPKPFRFRLQRYLDYRTFKTDQGRRKIAQVAAKLDQVQTAVNDAMANMESAGQKIEENRGYLREVQRQSWESTGDWTRTNEQARMQVAESEAERHRLRVVVEKVRSELPAVRSALIAARSRHLQLQRFQDGLEALRAQEKSEFQKQEEAAEMEEAAEAFSAMAWIERGES